MKLDGPEWTDSLKRAAEDLAKFLEESGVRIDQPAADTVDGFPDVFLLHDGGLDVTVMASERNGRVYFMNLTRKIAFTRSNLLASMLPGMTAVVEDRGWSHLVVMANLSEVDEEVSAMLEGSKVALLCRTPRFREFMTVLDQDVRYLSGLDEGRTEKFEAAIVDKVPAGSTFMGLPGEVRTVISEDVLESLI